MTRIMLTLSALLLTAEASAGMLMKMKQTVDFRGSKRQYTATLAVVPMASRVDVNPLGGDGGPAGSMYVITRLDKKVIWFIMPGAETYYELTFDGLNRLQNSKSFEWKNSNPLETGQPITYTRAKGRKTILGRKTRLYNVEQDDASGTAFVQEGPLNKTLVKFAANSARAFEDAGLEVESPELPGMVLAADTERESGHRTYWIATELRNKRFAADTFDPPPGATPVTFNADVADMWAKGIEEFKANFATAIKEEIKTQAKESVKRESKKAAKGAAKKAFKGLFKKAW